MSDPERTDPGRRFCVACGTVMTESAAGCGACEAGPPAPGPPILADPISASPVWDLGAARTARRRRTAARAAVLVVATVVVSVLGFVVVFVGVDHWGP